MEPGSRTREVNGERRPQHLFLDHLPLVERVVAFTCRRHHVGEADAEEFASVVKVKLLEDDYAVFRKFQGQSRLSTYLTIVVQRMFFDWLRAKKGRPRPSAEARGRPFFARSQSKKSRWTTVVR